MFKIKQFNMNTNVVILISIILAIGCVAFLYGIYKACEVSLKKTPPDPTEMPSALSSIVTTIGAILATNLGAVLGIQLSNSTLAFEDSTLWHISLLFKGTPTGFQIIFCYIYLGALVAVATVWVIRKFNDQNVIPLIPELSKTLIGIIIGVLALTLSTKPPSDSQKPKTATLTTKEKSAAVGFLIPYLLEK